MQSGVGWRKSVARENAPPPVALTRPPSVGAGFASVDSSFARKLDQWGAYHRVVVGSLTMAVAFTLLPQPPWLLSIAFGYLLVAALLPKLLEVVATSRRKARLRFAVMLIDIGLVTIFASHWGARTSPAAFMYVPMVSGWTLIPQRHLGRISAFTALFAYGALLAAEQLGWLAGQPSDGTQLTAHSTTGALLYLATLACALAAVHGLVDFTVSRLREHSQVVTRLTVERRAREQEMLLASQLEEAQRLEALGRLAGSVAHDLNNLLTVLMGCAELAEANVERDPPAARRALSDLQTTAERGATLAAQLLEFASRRYTSPCDLDLNESLTGSVRLLERLLDANITLSFERSVEPCVVHIDPLALERLLLNLAMNARDAMPTGGELALSLSVEREGGTEYALLQVRDTGTGIAPDDLPRIFEPFFTTKSRGKGAGLGLASVYGIVKQSQGEITVESTEGVGTTFRLRFPRRQAAPSPRVRTPVPAGGQHELILLVDDDAEVRSVLLAHLEDAGYRALPASSAEEALALLARHGDAVRMLVSDVSMPGMSGVELARHVRRERGDLPILLISGYSEEPHGELQGIARFLGKPFAKTRLLEEVGRGLAREPSRAQG